MNTPSHPMSGRLWVVQLSETLSHQIRLLIQDWPSAEKQKLGDQLMRATDSVGANISEGYARMHIKERLNFISIAQGSLEESLFWLRRARERALVSKLHASSLSGLFIKLSKALANFASAQRSRV